MTKRLHRGPAALPKLCLATAALLLLSAGACKNGGGDLGSVLPAPELVVLEDVQTRVFTPRCAVSGCHVGTDAPFGLDLSAGNAAGNLIGVASAEVPQFQRVEPLDAADSYLYMKLTADPRILGDPMPAFGDPLGSADLSLVESWIDQGAQ